VHSASDGFYRRCGVKDLSLRLNSLGDLESKRSYREVLVAFLAPKKSQLSEDSQRRLIRIHCEFSIPKILGISKLAPALRPLPIRV